jgi:hypothetical protein
VAAQRTIFGGLLELRRGAARQWSLTPGRYTITVTVKDRRDLNRLTMETDGLSCSRDSRDENTIHCVATSSAQVSLHHRPTSVTAAARADVKLRQVR